MNIAIIPARGGSKRIKKKNIKNFYKMPMISWPIKSLKKSKLFQKIIVSTDSNEIAKIAVQHGAEVPFLRNKNIADDFTPTLPVIKDAISRLNYNFKIKNICCVYPCSPFLDINDLLKTFNILNKNKNNFVFPVIENSHPIERSFKLIGKKKLVKFIFRSKEMSRTQDLIKSYHDAGQFYWGTKKSWMNKKRLHSDSCGYIVPSWKYVDIDNLDDWKRAEKIFKLIK